MTTDFSARTRILKVIEIFVFLIPHFRHFGQRQFLTARNREVLTYAPECFMHFRIRMSKSAPSDPRISQVFQIIVILLKYS